MPDTKPRAPEEGVDPEGPDPREHKPSPMEVLSDFSRAYLNSPSTQLLRQHGLPQPLAAAQEVVANQPSGYKPTFEAAQDRRAVLSARGAMSPEKRLGVPWDGRTGHDAEGVGRMVVQGSPGSPYLSAPNYHYAMSNLRADNRDHDGQGSLMLFKDLLRRGLYEEAQAFLQGGLQLGVGDEYSDPTLAPESVPPPLVADALRELWLAQIEQKIKSGERLTPTSGGPEGGRRYDSGRWDPDRVPPPSTPEEWLARLEQETKQKSGETP
jgi:hypothetical protein